MDVQVDKEAKEIVPDDPEAAGEAYDRIQIELENKRAIELLKGRSDFPVFPWVN